MSFFTVVNCMDGRVQLPVINYLMKRFNVDYVDSITEPGPNRILALQDDPELVQSIIRRIKISLERHKSKGIAIVGHYDCAGNPVTEKEHVEQLKKAKIFLEKHFQDSCVEMLWVDENWQVHQLT